MSTFYIVLLFPVISGLGWGIAKGLLALTSGARAPIVLMRRSGWLHLLFVSIPAAAVLAAALNNGTLDAIGLRWPSVGRLPVSAATGLMVVAGIASGLLIYVNELAVSSKIRQLLSRRPSGALNTVVQGRSGALWIPEAPPFADFMGASALTSFAEELVWRGYLVAALMTAWHLNLALALFVSSLLFGINHSYFGLRNVLLKALAGVWWGLLCVATGSILAPFVSHLTFQYLVWRRLERRRRIAVASADVQVRAAGGFR